MLPSSKLLKLEKQVVLASASPRRQQLLKLIIDDFVISPSGYDESLISIRKPNDYVTSLAYEKANFVANNSYPESIVIGSDTCVALGDKILNKPIDEKDAFRMLKELSNSTHYVYTGIAIIDKSANKIIKTYKKTEVRFREVSDSEISAYVATGSPMDKAGAYGIQDDFGAVFVSEIKGCYYNIVGLPLELLYRSLKDF